MSGLPPLILQPDLRRRPWGGSTLPGLWKPGAARVEDGVEPVGEAWLAGPESLVDQGPHRGSTLAELAAIHGQDLVGRRPFATYGARVPLLLKLLDAAEDLSVQVHPDDAYALREEAQSGHLGKTEAWWVLQADPGARVTWGFKEITDAGTVRLAVEQGRLPDLLHSFEVAPGTVVVNPAGTVHALGAGLLVYEVQQASDLTYRLYDHGRLGPDGRPRALHLDKALAVADYRPGSPPAEAAVPSSPGHRELARTPAFVLQAVDTSQAGAWVVDEGSLELLTHLQGEPVTLRWPGGELTLAPWDTCLIPAGTGEVRPSGGQARLARVWVP